VAGEIPSGVRGAIERGLSSAPGDRFATMTDLLGALAAETRPGERARVSVRWVRPAAYGLASVMVGLVIVSLANRQRAAETVDPSPPLPSAFDPAGPEAPRATPAPSLPAPAAAPPFAASQEPSGKPTAGRPNDHAAKRPHGVKPRPAGSGSSSPPASSARPYDDQPMAPTFGAP
jgi:hypothetical protein